MAKLNYIKNNSVYFVFPLLVVTLLMLSGFSVRKNNRKKISKPFIEFETKQSGFLTYPIVNKLLIQNTQGVENKPKSVIDLYSLETGVLSSPYVEDAMVYMTIDGTLNAYVKQREPIARIQSDSAAYYVDKYGFKMPLSSEYTARVILVEGVENKKEDKEITELVNLILKDNFLKKEIVGIQKTKGGEYNFSVRSGDYKIAFGNFTDVNLKFSKLKVFYNKAFTDKTINNYKIINVKYHNQVVCTK